MHNDVLQAMLPYFSKDYGNASSNHFFGWRTEQAVENARESIARLLNVEPGEIYFTSGATESINCAVQGIWNIYKDHRPHFITVRTEHSNGTSDSFTCNHSMNNLQIEWFNAGSAMNYLRNQ